MHAYKINYNADRQTDRHAFAARNRISVEEEGVHLAISLTRIGLRHES